MLSKWRQQSRAVYPLAGWIFHGSGVACPFGQLEAVAWGGGNASHSVGKGRACCKSGKGKLEASCNQSRFSGVNRVSVRLKISLPVAEPSHRAREESQSAQG